MTNKSSSSWSVDDLRRNAKYWSLEGDSKLLEYMESISKNLENRCETTTNNINKMLLNLNESNVYLGNTTNKLLALSHSQFVENRVYDEDETIANIVDVPVVTDTDKTTLSSLETLQLIVNNGLKMMNNCYEKVILDLNDSEDEDGGIGVATCKQKSIMFRSKDPYQNRPLPFLIGSKEWKEKWHIGLIDSDDDEKSEKEINEEFSGSSVEDETSLSASLPSNAQTMSESECSAWGLHTSNAYPKPDLFRHSSEEELSISSQIDNNVTIRNNKQLSRPIVQQRNLSSTVTPKQEQSTEKHLQFPKTNPRNLFDDSDSDIEQYVETISNLNKAKPIPNTIFRKQTTIQPTVPLLDSEPPELDFMDNSIAKTENRKPINLFLESDEDDNDFFSRMKPFTVPIKHNFIENNTAIKSNTCKENLNERNNDTSTVNPIPAPRLKKKNLFDDDDDDDKNNFDSFINSDENKKNDNLPEKTKSIILFDDEPPDDLFDTIISSKTTDNITARKSSINSNNYNDDNSYDANSINNNDKSNSDKKKEQIITIYKKTNKSNLTKQNLNLFDENIEVISKTHTDKIDKTVNLFDDQNEALMDVTKITNLFDEDISDTFNHSSKMNENDNVIDKKTTDGIDKNANIISNNDSNKDNNNVKSKTDTIFSDDDFDIFKKIPNDRNKLKIENIFGDESDDDFTAILNKDFKLYEPPPLESKLDIVHNTNAIESEHKILIEQKPSEDFNITEKFDKNSKLQFENMFEDDEVINQKNYKYVTPTQLSEEVSDHSTVNSKSNVLKQLRFVEENFEKFNEEPIANNSDNDADNNFESDFDNNLENISSDNEIDNFESNDRESYFTDEMCTKQEGEIISNKISKDNKILENEAVIISEFQNEIIVDRDEDIFEKDPIITNESNFLEFCDVQSVTRDKLCDNSFKTTDKTINNSALDYSSIPIFDDIPPDDDFLTDTKTKIPNIFYDDFAETIIQSNINQNSIKTPTTTPSTTPPTTTATSILNATSSYLFNDEPPPDDENAGSGNDEIDKIIIENNSKDISSELVVRRPTKNDKLQIIENDNLNIQQQDDGKTLNDDQKAEKKAIKKLNVNLNINVSALLPGAKPPPLSTLLSKTEIISQEIYNKEDNDLEDNQINYVNSPNMDINTGRLVNLNKSRPKVSVQRKPSTRTARQQEYKKTILNDIDNEINNTSTDNNLKDRQISDVTLLKQNQLQNENDDLTISKVSISIPIDNEKNIETEIPKPTADDIESDWLLNANKDTINDKMEISSEISEINSNIKKNVNQLSLFGVDADEDDDDDLFAIKSIKSLAPVAVATSTNMLDKKLSESTTSKTKIIEQKSFVIKTEETIKSYSIFESDNDDEGDLFGNISKKNLNKAINTEKSSLKPLSTKLNKTSIKGNLFNYSDDEDDDDLFSTKNKVQKKLSLTKPNKTLTKSIKITSTENDPLADLMENK